MADAFDYGSDYGTNVDYGSNSDFNYQQFDNPYWSNDPNNQAFDYGPDMGNNQSLGSADGFDPNWYVQGTQEPYSGGNWLSTLGNWGANAYDTTSSALSGLGSFFNKNQNLIGTALNLYGAYKANDAFKGAPSYQPIQNTSQMLESPEIQALKNDLATQVSRNAAARGYKGTSRELQEIADTAYSRAILPTLQSMQAENANKNQQDYQAWLQSAQAKANMWKTGTSTLASMGQQGQMSDLINQLITQALGPTATPEEEAGLIAGLNGAEPDPSMMNNSKYMKAFIKGKQMAASLKTGG